MKKSKILPLILLLAANYVQGTTLLSSVKNGIFASDPVPYEKGDKFFAKNGNKPPVLLSVLEKKGSIDLINVLPNNKIKHVGKKGDTLKIIDTDKYPIKTFKAPSPVTGRGLLDKNIIKTKIVRTTKIAEKSKKRLNPELILPPLKEYDNHPKTAKAYTKEQHLKFESLNTEIKAIPEYYSPTPHVKEQTNKILGVKPKINIIIVESLPNEFVKEQKIILNSETGNTNQFEVIKVNSKFTMLKSKDTFQNTDYLLHNSINNYLK